MDEPKELNLFDMFGHKFPSRDERLRKSYLDPVVLDRFGEIMDTPETEHPGLQAQLTTYLAAAHILFPEESQIIYKSLKKGDSNGQ